VGQAKGTGLRLCGEVQRAVAGPVGLPVARSLRELIDWPRVRRETEKSPYAEAFLILLDRLDVVPFPDDEEALTN